MISAEQISKELADIQNRIPKNLLLNVLSKKKANPTVKKVAELAIADPNFPKAKKEHLKLLLARGDFDKEVYIENSLIVKQIDNFVNREINKKIKAGRLPHKSQIGKLPHVREIYQRVTGLTK